MLGSIIGAGVSAAASIGGGIAAGRAMRNLKKQLNQQKNENQEWYDRRYNEDSTQRADAQRLLTMTEESIRNRNAQAAGSAAVMGGTDESVAAAKAANAEALSNTMSQINASGEARKENIENKYLDTKANLNQQIANLEMNRAQNITQAAKGVGDAAMSLGNAMSGVPSK